MPGIQLKDHPGYFNPYQPYTNPANNGGIIRNLYSPNTNVNTSIQDNFNKYKTDFTKNQNDYDMLNNQYNTLLNKQNNRSPITFTEPSKYTRSQDWLDAQDQLKELTQTGGYSNNDIYNLRERGISPIRSIYANSLRDIGRQRNLQGGYSPAYSALKAKMARESSEQMAKAMTDVNAGLADKINSAKTEAIGKLASFTDAENARENEFNMNRNKLLNDLITKKREIESSDDSDVLRTLQSIGGTLNSKASNISDWGRQSGDTAAFQQNVINSNDSKGMELVKMLLNNTPTGDPKKKRFINSPNDPGAASMVQRISGFGGA